jgi:hypothetical protein
MNFMFVTTPSSLCAHLPHLPASWTFQRCHFYLKISFHFCVVVCAIVLKNFLCKKKILLNFGSANFWKRATFSQKKIVRASPTVLAWDFFNFKSAIKMSFKPIKLRINSVLVLEQLYFSEYLSRTTTHSQL